MHLIIASREDEASMAIAGRLLEKTDFKPADNTGQVLVYGDYLFSYIDVKHLYFDNFREVFGSMENKIEDIIFLSKHSSQADIKSLTVHPTGNFADAKLGGRERKLSMSDPGKMSSTLRYMYEYYKGTTFSVTFEATHHGPLLDIPNFFLEIGTTREQWKDPEALDTVVSAILSDGNRKEGAFVGAGGGHYMPKITKYSIENGVDVGHMISKHALEQISSDMIAQSAEKTPGCRGFIVDRKGVKAPARQLIRDFCDNSGLEVITV